MQFKPTLAVIAGAGASLRAGAPSTQELFEVVMAALPGLRITIAPDGKKSMERVDLAKVIRDALATRGDEADFELAMGLLEELYSCRLGTGSLFATVARLQDTIAPSVDGPLLSGAYSSANTEIVRKFIDEASTPSQAEVRESLRQLFARLAERARVVLASLNYDVFLDDALPWADGFIPVGGWPYGRFDPTTWLRDIDSRERHLLMHLHGSVRYGFGATMDLQMNTPFGEPVLYPSAEEAFDSTHGTSVGWPSSDGSMLQATPIITGGHKSPKMMQNPRPYAYYNAAALQEIAEADALLIIGYGFRDAHVNAWIDEHIRLHAHRKVAVVTRRTCKDIGENTAVERFLMKLAAGRNNLDWTYEPVPGGAPPRTTRDRVGGMYLVTTGVPMASDSEEAVLAYLFEGSSR